MSRRKRTLLFFTLFLLMGVGTCIPTSAAELPTMSQVQLDRYIGIWYEIARLPNAFQDDIKNDGSGYSQCLNTTAEYTPTDSQKMTIVNTCYRQKGSEVRVEEAHGRARATDASFSKLKVNFTGNPILEALGIGDGDYWILDLGPVDDGLYSYALVGTPSLNHLWVLSRSLNLDQETVKRLLRKAKHLGFPTENIIYSR